VGRLDDQVSPYLRAHAHQAIDWFPWGDEAFAEAARRDCPVMISIGYHTCHWCHVMSRESFDDPELARVLNDTLVAIKVDREEHPEVDQAYLAQAAAYTDNLGWPLTVFATPQGHTFYAATYLPPQPRGGLPSLSQVVAAVGAAWREKRVEVLESAAGLIEAIAQAQPELAHSGTRVPEPAQLAAVVEAVALHEDTEYGGIGGAPKFPMAPVVQFLQGRGRAGDDRAGALARRLLEAYASSGLRDPVDGGFFRYATGRDFSEPHYERMLDDNAGLLEAYARSGMVEIASGIVSFLRSTLLVEGAFASAQDSESVLGGERVEGGYYRLDPADRQAHTPPAIDTKVITGWNGLALCALAQADLAGCSGDPGPLGETVASWLIEHHQRPDGSLIRVSEAGRVSSAPATGEDYGGFALGLIEVGMARGNRALIEAARRAIDWVIAGGLASAGDRVLAARGVPVPGSTSEGAHPSGPAMLARAAYRLSALTLDQDYLDYALRTIHPFVADAMANPLGHGGVLRALSELASPPRELLVAAEGPSELSDIARAWRAEGAVSLVLTPAQAGEFAAAGYQIATGRDEPGSPRAYVCQRGVCALPVTDPEELRALLAG